MTMPPPAMRVVMWQRRHHLRVDGAVAAVFLALNIIVYVANHGVGVLAETRWNVLGCVVTVMCAAALALRRRWPVLAWAGCCVLPLVWFVVMVDLFSRPVTSAVILPSLFTLAGVPLCLSAIAGTKGMGSTTAFYAVSVALATVLDVRATEDGGSASNVLITAATYAILYVVGVLVGLIMRVQTEQLAELEARSERLALAREQSTLLAAANERSRIAREMHDVVAHSLAVMITMAEGAAATIDRSPAMAKEALTTLAETGRSALADTRRLVGVLRDDPAATSAPAGPEAQGDQRHPEGPGSVGGPGLLGGAPTRPSPGPDQEPKDPGAAQGPVVRDLPVPEFAPPGTVAPREPSVEIADLRRQATEEGADTSAGDTPLAPAPEHADLVTLVERFQAAGVPVDYRWRGGPLPEDKALQLTVFRIAQEALTNVLRYAPTTRAVSVDLDRHRGTAVLTIDNDAAPGSTPMHGSGKGLVGMRERAAVYGGSVQAGPTATGWRVRAVLHWDEDEEGTSPWQMPL
ncbi:sensory histidine kinase UhpB [Actinomyces howellii]|uniref:histidine kinase n=2 Tax=Actinomyces howellii TaxID=52771 RepID=A0A3S4TB10_9ACTO|nr:sensory histidine kinase UhpB [Actinomyces howellii]